MFRGKGYAVTHSFISSKILDLHNLWIFVSRWLMHKYIRNYKGIEKITPYLRFIEFYSDVLSRFNNYALEFYFSISTPTPKEKKIDTTI